jgi:hypothetical protein
MSSRKGFNHTYLERLDQPIVRPTSQKFAAVGLCHYQSILTVNFSQLVESSAGRLRA